MNYLQYVIFSTLLLWSISVSSQETYPVNGPRNTVHNFYAFTNANVVSEPGEVINNATLLIRDDRIIAVGNGVEIPKNAVVYDLNDGWIYASFIDLYSNYGMEKKKTTKSNSGRPQYQSNMKGAYAWNEAIQPERNAVDAFKVDNKKAAQLRSMGFATVLTHQHDGIMRGTSVLVHTGNEKENLCIIKDKATTQMSFSKGSSRQQYPSSLMGSIALIRQNLYDAKWYASESEKKEFNLSLKAINDNSALKVIFDPGDHLSVLRAAKVGEEFGMNLIVKGSGLEYARIDAIKETGLPLILPLKFPLPYNLDNAYDALDLRLQRMMEWENAPFNARRLSEAQVPYSFTSEGLSDKEFWANLKKVKKTGLSEDVILQALTVNPAAFIGLEGMLGKLKANYKANFIVFSEPFLGKESAMLEHWVNGNRHIIHGAEIDIRGEYNLNINKNTGLLLKVDGSLLKPKATVFKGKEKRTVQLKRYKNEISLKFEEIDGNGTSIVLTGTVNDNESRIWVGKGQLATGKWVDWAAIKQTTTQTVDSANMDTTRIPLPRISYPLGAYGFDSLPETAYVLFKHATVWTNESEGILENTDVCIADGKILAIGPALNRLSLFGTKEVDLSIIEAKGKHITSGIIDEHSHIAISRGVNESGQASSAEVRIGDVINSDDINIYRQLAGGVTASQLLHGSANPIGGQSALIKLRWGSSPEEMKIEDAVGFIKFALGENVKQSNWGDRMKYRYPQTRMGVEQVFYDGFYRAKEYSEMRQIYEAGLKTKKKKQAPIEPKIDLELKALSEILDSNRFITCHSYVQSEINMLMHVGDSMGFRVNTFTHILEGYKVSDKMKDHGAGGSTFSDWWAYKYEVNDAIPYNAALMMSQGVVTAINSDDAEMGRRLNQEAAKVHKYGGVSRQEAWKTVTLNPAKLLHLDSNMGSLKVGKDADIVLWSDDPLSINARAEQTYVDGKLLFDIERDRQLRLTIENERARLIQKMMNEGGKKGKKQEVKKEEEILYHCDSEEYHEEDN